MTPAARAEFFVTGASGFVGQRVLELLASSNPGGRFRALVHRSPVMPRANVEAVQGSLEDEEGLRRALAGVATVVHLAAVTHASDREQYLRVNGVGTENLVRAAARTGVTRFVLVSSRAIRPECGAYAVSKRRGEEAVEASGVPYVIVRCSEVYGPGTAEGLSALVALVRRTPVVPYPSGPVTLAPLFLDDAVGAIAAAADRRHLANQVYTVAGPRVYTFREAIRSIAEAFSLRRLAIPVPLAAFALAARMSAWTGRPLVRDDQISRLRCAKDNDIGRARRDLGFAPISFEEGLRAMGRLAGQSPPSKTSRGTR